MVGRKAKYGVANMSWFSPKRDLRQRCCDRVEVSLTGFNGQIVDGVDEDTSNARGMLSVRVGSGPHAISGPIGGGSNSHGDTCDGAVDSGSDSRCRLGRCGQHDCHYLSVKDFVRGRNYFHHTRH